MEFNRIIEGYSDNAVRSSSTYLSKLRSKMNLNKSLSSKLRTITNERNKLQKKYESTYNDYIIDDPNLKLTKAEKERVLSVLKEQIKELEKEIANLEYDIKSTNAESDRKYNNKLIPAEKDFVKRKEVTDNKLDEILPLKKKENGEAKNYFNLLISQNEEVLNAIVGKKNDLTTADRRYVINDTKHPYYVTLNRGLLFLYIIVALYVIYKVMFGMITQNIYGKLIIVLLISLYPIYIFGLEKSIYNQYLFIKAMLRAEPYIPTK